MASGSRDRVVPGGDAAAGEAPLPGPENPPVVHSAVPDDTRLAAHAFHLPAPTYWPAALALGVTLVLFGIVTTFIFSAVGALLIIAGLVGWIGDLLHG